MSARYTENWFGDRQLDDVRVNVVLIDSLYTVDPLAVADVGSSCCGVDHPVRPIRCQQQCAMKYDVCVL